MPEKLSGHSTGSGPDRMTAGAISHRLRMLRNPVLWLTFCGVLLIAGIAIGTAMMVGNFRERALDASKRELENAMLLLARHFDQQLEDFGAIQEDLYRIHAIGRDRYERALQASDVQPRHQPDA